MAAPLAPSRLPVGSSANSTSGAAPWRGPAPRAAARRPTIGPDNVGAFAQTRPPPVPPAARSQASARPTVPAAPRHSPAPSWSESDERTGTRCPPGRAGSAPRLLAHAGDVGAGDGHPSAGGPFQPAATINSEDLPEPDGPVSATLWPAPAPSSDTPLRILTGPAALASCKWTSDKLMAGAEILHRFDSA